MNGDLHVYYRLLAIFRDLKVIDIDEWWNSIHICASKYE